MFHRLVVLVSVFSLSAHAESAWDKKRNEFQEKALKARQKLGLKNGKTPGTPELSFATPLGGGGGSGDSGTVVLCPGASIDVKLKSNLSPGSLFIATSDDVTISKEKQADGVWSATLTAKPTPAPRAFSIQAVDALTGREASVGQFLLACKHTLLVDAAEARVTLTVDFSSGATEVGSKGQWVKGTTKGEADFQVKLQGDGFSVVRAYSQEQMQEFIKNQSAAMSSPQFAALNAKFAKAAKKMDPCSKVAPAKMMDCMKAPQAEMEAVADEMKKFQQANDLKDAPKDLCAEVSLRFTTGTSLEGEGKRCPNHVSTDEVPATGQLTTP
jgi:cellobiose-specific phosphotransferase system component IIB